MALTYFLVAVSLVTSAVPSGSRCPRLFLPSALGLQQLILSAEKPFFVFHKVKPENNGLGPGDIPPESHGKVHFLSHSLGVLGRWGFFSFGANSL